MTPALAIAGICALATLGIIVRPFKLPEAVPALLGAAALVATGLIAPATALAAIAKGTDVYLFLAGMMLLAETARREALFDWLAGHAVARARGSPVRLFTLIFLLGVVVTAFLSNDATAVVLTPAVFAVARKAQVDPLPMLFACAMIANAASFVLPISNPANLVVFGAAMPPLGAWLARFALPSVVAIAATYAALRLVERHRLGGDCVIASAPTGLPRGAAVAAAGIAGTALLLLVTSALGQPLGPPTAIAGTLAALVTLIRRRQSPMPLLKSIDWAIVPLVAALFVMVEALHRTGLIATLANVLATWSARAPDMAALGGAGLLSVAVNLVNNLPAGLLTSTVITAAAPPRAIVDSLLIAVDLGPNLSVFGSLATILWLGVLRREGQRVGFRQFLKVGLAVMPSALLLAVGTRLMLG